MGIVPKPRQTMVARGSSATLVPLAGALMLAGSATTDDLTLVPDHRGSVIHRTAQDRGAGQAGVSIGRGEEAYSGNWVAIAPNRTAAVVAVGAARRSRGHYDGGPIVDHGSAKAVAKALLQVADRSGPRWGLFGLNGGQGTGRCLDNKGLA